MKLPAWRQLPVEVRRRWVVSADLNLAAIEAFYGRLIAAKVEEDANKDSRLVNLTDAERTSIVVLRVQTLIHEMAEQVHA